MTRDLSFPGAAAYSLTLASLTPGFMLSSLRDYLANRQEFALDRKQGHGQETGTDRKYIGPVPVFVLPVFVPNIGPDPILFGRRLPEAPDASRLGGITRFANTGLANHG